MISEHEALIYIMVLAAAADTEMTDSEIAAIGEQVMHLPAFRDFTIDNLPKVASDCAALLNEEDGLEQILASAHGALTPALRETAYALALDVVAADLHAAQEELRVLELIRHRLDIDRLIAAAIERGARARHQSIGGA